MADQYNIFQAPHMRQWAAGAHSQRDRNVRDTNPDKVLAHVITRAAVPLTIMHGYCVIRVSEYCIATHSRAHNINVPSHIIHTWTLYGPPSWVVNINADRDRRDAAEIVGPLPLSAGMPYQGMGSPSLPSGRTPSAALFTEAYMERLPGYCCYEY